MTWFKYGYPPLSKFVVCWLNLQHWSVCDRYRTNLARQHLPTGEHTELRPGAGVDDCCPEGIQQCRPWIRRRKHHHQGKDQNKTLYIPLELMEIKSVDVHVYRILWLFWDLFLHSLVVKNRRCPWTAVEKLSGPSTLRSSRPTSRPSETRMWRMESGSLWRSKTWAAVRSTLRPWLTTPTEGEPVFHVDACKL